MAYKCGHCGQPHTYRQQALICSQMQSRAVLNVTFKAPVPAFPEPKK